MMDALGIRGIIQRETSDGPTEADDAAPVTTGSVYAVDPPHGRVQVGVRGGVVWLPAIAGRYTPESLARILLDPFTGRPSLVAGPVFPSSPVTLGTVVSGPTANRLTLTIGGVQVTVPAAVGAYSVGSGAWVLLDDWGIPMLALGPAEPPRPTPPLEPPTPIPPATETATATIGPQWSGTWRQTRWGNWNQNRYGGVSDIYQGSADGSGPLIGLAAYGDQIVNLGAVSIDEAILQARKTADGNSAVLTVQGSPHGGQPGGAPAGGGDTASSGSIRSGAWGDVALTGAMREALRTGAAKGLIAVGGQYGGFGGTATAGSFVLRIRYTRHV
jgi:hypothetical protein